MNKNEFYIGWQQNAPDTIIRYIRKVVLILLLCVIIISALLSFQQRKFSTASFEYGQLTEVRGIYHATPVPMLKVISPGDINGRTGYITMPLAGYGKSGAEGVIKELEEQSGVSFDNKEVVFKGTLIYHDGKTVLQIDRHDHPMVSVKDPGMTVPVVKKELGDVQLNGEILDPKCYFGVMKPGHGKVHRDCAVRCIEGGICPVFYVYNEKGETAYYLLLDEDGNKMNAELKDYVAEPVTLSARAVQYDDWTVLYIKKGSIRRTGGISLFKTDDISCTPFKE